MTHRHDILSIASKHGIHHLRVVEPALLGGGHRAGEVDFLVEPDPGQNLRELGNLLLELEDLLGREVCVVTPNGLREPIRERVLREALPL